MQIPSLNLVSLSSLRDGCLVRYTGMVQDQFDPEFYFKVFTFVDGVKQVHGYKSLESLVISCAIVWSLY